MVENYSQFKSNLWWYSLSEVWNLFVRLGTLELSLMAEVFDDFLNNRATERVSRFSRVHVTNISSNIPRWNGARVAHGLCEVAYIPERRSEGS